MNENGREEPTKNNEKMVIFVSDALSEKSFRGSIISNKSKDGFSEIQTVWRPIIITGVIFFLVGVESAMTGISEWPYMHTIDRNATYDFFGTANAIANWGHIVFSIIFALWCYNFQTVKWPLLAGRVLAILGSILYILVEVFPTNRRYVMLACYIIFSIASSSSVVLRAYFVEHSAPKDRARACALISLSTVISIVIGPLIQLAFSPLKFPGKKVGNGVYFNMFSGPIWIATFVNIPTILLIIFALPEMKKDQSRLFPRINWNFIRDKINIIRRLEVNWILVAVMLFERVVIGLTLNTLGQVISEMFIVVWGLATDKVIVWGSSAMAVVGGLGLLTTGIFILTPLSRLVHSRTILLIGLCACILMYIFAYPYPFSSRPVAEFNVTTGIGCSPRQYSWCSHTRGVNIWVFLAIVVVSIGIALPSVLMSIDTIYSKVVGEANQNLMQGFAVVIDDIVNVGAPLYVTHTFTNAGPTIFWIINGSITILGTIVWLVAYHWMKNF